MKCLSMDAAGLDFQAIFRLLCTGSAPSLSSEELSSRISSCVDQTANTPAPSVTHTDLMCLCLTLIEAIINKLTAQSLPQDVTIFYEDVKRRLFEEMNLMAKLVSLLNCQDQLVSHLSAKCISVYVISDISINGGSSSIWRHRCAEVFQKPTASSELDSCLWSLTAVIKGVLRGEICQRKRDVLMKLLSGLDASITSLHTNLLTQDTQDPHKRELINISKTMCEFFDLLEVLSAARLRYGVCSPVQRVIFVHSRGLLRVMRADVEYFVKKRALLLLKKSLLRRAGDDWALGEAQSASREDHSLSEDMLAMADGVLQEVNAGWLKEVPVKSKASFFGGNCDVRLTGTQKDDVMLRAVSLVLLKSLEINIQRLHCKGSQSDIDIRQYLTELMSFLQRHGTLMSADAHSCSWVSVVFAEQDDDMMESSKTLIGLYLYQKSLSSSDSGVCVWGCNPHCHFILLLRSLSFDHTVLLDFLISSETCFLEYCVHYLKLLREDRTGLCRSCRHIEDCDGRLGATRGGTDPSVQAPSANSETLYVVQAGNEVSVPRLVDYGSSDDSDEAEEHVSGKTDVDSGRTEASFCPSEMVLEQVQTEYASEFLLDKVFVCLMDLRTTVTRLHNRGLFPYNPTSLLKLLNSVERQRNRVS
ncbi:protein Lines homolog 1 isoform X1 [Pimephales promelas]|uniref:protein Lines homolog 1 isoform X1 n=2 Tax=Pimephales promelas TaxID=90988 RepID=UPI001955E32E|nr:protein Lines homolog 1 isoform X1 [Pimephales promelas]XP_039528757.1 protein Lines homolog 1 isoform X1 [Pimephales promelas]XP_039528817.1 protein Lines homolog 1 isoform X1 [Pimephales promelas]